jgi:hypothetical protein
MQSIKTFFRRVPFTLIMLTGLSLVALATNTTFEAILHHWINRLGFSSNDLWYWRIERMFTSALVTSGSKVFWDALFFVAFAVGLAEWMAGWKRAAATFWEVHLLVLILLSLIVSLAAHQLPDIGLKAIEATRNVGPSAGYFACLGLISAQLKRPWNLVSGAALFAMFVLPCSCQSPGRVPS